MEFRRFAQATWTGSFPGGLGLLSTESGTLQHSPYSFATRFGTQPGSNPEELVAAAHAGCFAMAFAAILAHAGFPPEKIEVRATITMKKTARSSISHPQISKRRS